MYKQTNFSDENKKRAAFRRFSQIGATGLAVVSLSAFSDLSAQQLPAKVDTSAIKEKKYPLPNTGTDNLFITDEEMFIKSDSPSLNPPSPYGNYSKYLNTWHNHIDYSDYSDYSNNYSDNC